MTATNGRLTRRTTTSLTPRAIAPLAIAALTILAAGCGTSTSTSVDSGSDDSTASTSETSTSSQPVTDDTAESATETESDEASGDEFPTITAVDASVAGDGTWTIEVTVSSPYDSAERYADAWRVLDESGNELAIRELSHDHASEQPFTRDVKGVEIPETVESITVEGRDLKNGWGGQTFTLSLPSSSSY